jgi:hypothetical protein
VQASTQPNFKLQRKIVVAIITPSFISRIAAAVEQVIDGEQTELVNPAHGPRSIGTNEPR